MKPSTAVTNQKHSLVYPALLSKVAEAFENRIVTGERNKNSLTYTKAFTGAEAVDALAHIIKTSDRNLALLLGRALDAQKFIHDVTYDHRLRDTHNEVYQFRERTFDEDASTTGVNGVFTLLSECYSPTCSRDRLCYSIACPRRLEQQARLMLKIQPGLKRNESRSSIHAEETEKKLWIYSVPKDVADSVSDKERKRQEVICEFMYTERDFVKDLEYLRDCWMKPLRRGSIIAEHRREKFIRAVFANILDIHAVNVKLAEALTKRQQQNPVVREVGDIIIEYAKKFEPYIQYGANQVYGKYEFEREKASNPLFAKFVDETERLKESRKLELNGYLTKPTSRLARYPLLLDAILKNTCADSPDQTNIPKAIEIVRGFLTRLNAETGKAENRFNLLQLNQSLVFRPGEHFDLKLTEENRQLIFKGFLKKRMQDAQADIQAFLFDHSLLFVRVKNVNKREQLKVHRKPVPLELLVISQYENATSRLALAKRPSTSLIHAGRSAQGSKIETSNTKYPLSFVHLGRRGYELTLYAPTFVSQKKWMEHIEAQQKKLRERSGVYAKHILSASFFDSQERVNCAIPFDGSRKLLYGTDHGIFWSEMRVKPGTIAQKPTKILAMTNVSQIELLEEYGMMLVLADKTLYSFPLDAVLEATIGLSVHDMAALSRRAKKVVGHINFFRAGICLGQLFVCTVKSGSMTSTVRVWEPADHLNKGKKQPALKKLLQNQSETLKLYKEFYIPADTMSISFLKSMLCMGCSKGFEIVSLETLETQSLLDPADTSLDFVIRRETLKPLAIYRLNGDFLLNYTDFSFFVNRNGWRTRSDWIINWEGLPQAFSLCYPYILAFEPNFVEIRHAETGSLVQIIAGENIRFLHDKTRFLHDQTREILYAYEDENGKDVVASLDFWETGQHQHQNLQQQYPSPQQSKHQQL
ncbi:hypothetical protein CANCADRAFT_26059 [Tortispora caseinolytica NRRL Y-17796]|uniref:DH domain-containing protein n=1 Tax=Tortispora caseinolytica NRRL Y-17796 TaxID=767744 RepID=A0A1E4TEF9_9ASCO|nr:hypothetical protein CANCADRAFT_26059 [Tortispora caseinolytica NRRL Y-17796]